MGGLAAERLRAALVALSVGLGAWLLDGDGPEVLASAEVDALEGGVRLAEALTIRQGTLRERLVEGFRTYPGHPGLSSREVAEGPGRSSGSAPGSSGRDTLLPPVPRWFAALGVMLAPVPESTSNGRRASLVAAWITAFALAWVLLPWGRSVALVVGALALCAEPVREALTGFGHGAAATLGVSLVLAGLVRASSAAAPTQRAWSAHLRHELGVAALLGAGLALAIGTHPHALLLLLTPLLLPRSSPGAPGPDEPGAEPDERPALTLGLGQLAAPFIALALLVLVWPSLHARPGAGLLAWILGPGLGPQSAVEVLGATFQARSPQGFTALMQLALAVPLSVILLALRGALRPVGVSTRGARVAVAGQPEGPSPEAEGRGWQRASLLVLALLLVTGVAAGSLWGARLNLVPLLVPPLLVLAGAGLRALQRSGRSAGTPGRAEGLRLACLLVAASASWVFARAADLLPAGLERLVTPPAEGWRGLSRGLLEEPLTPEAAIARQVARDHLERRD